MLSAFPKSSKLTEHTHTAYFHATSRKFIRPENSCPGDIGGRGVASGAVPR